MNDVSRSSRAEYVARVNRVIDHIERNLGQPLSLTVLADVAHLSRFHFHRIFGAVVGETLGAFISRLRVERAAVMLVANPHASITEIALDCGFSNSATFARAFKEALGMSATKWRAQRDRKDCEANCKALGKHGQAATISACYLDPRTAAPSWRYEMSQENGSKVTGTIEVKELPAHHVVYLRHVGPYGEVDLVPRLVEQLRAWAVPRGLYTPDTRLLLVAHDSPEITEQDKLRLSICFTVPPGTKCEGEVGTMRIPGGKFAVGHFEIWMPKARSKDLGDMARWIMSSGQSVGHGVANVARPLATRERHAQHGSAGRPEQDREVQRHVVVSRRHAARGPSSRRTALPLPPRRHRPSALPLQPTPRYNPPRQPASPNRNR